MSSYVPHKFSPPTFSSVVSAKKSYDVLAVQESPIKKRRRGRPSKAPGLSSNKASLNSAAVLKAGSPKYRSPVMRVSPSHRDNAGKVKHILLVNGADPTPKGGSVVSFSKRQLTPVTKKLFAIKEKFENDSANSSFEAPANGFFKTPRSTGKASIFHTLELNREKEASKNKYRENYINHLKMNNSRNLENQFQKHDNNNNSFLVDPNNLFSSPVFASAQKEETLYHPDFLSSPVTNHKLVNSFEVQEPAIQDHYARIEALQEQQQITHENAANNSFNFSSIIQSSPIFHGYYMNSTPTSASTNKSVHESPNRLRNRHANDVIKLAVRPMVMKSEPRQFDISALGGAAADSDNDDSSYDDDADDGDFRNSKRLRAAVSLASEPHNKPLLPPVSIGNLEFSSSDEDEDIFLKRFQPRMSKSSPIRRRHNSGYTRPARAHRHINSLGLTIDALGRAMLAVNADDNTPHHGMEPQYGTHHHHNLVSSPSFQNGSVSPAFSGIAAHEPQQFYHHPAVEQQQDYNANELFGEEIRAANLHKRTRVSSDPQMSSNTLNSSPFINKFEEQQINEILSSTSEQLHGEPFPDFLYNQKRPNLHTDETVESDIDDEALLQNIINSESKPAMITISNKCSQKAHYQPEVHVNEGYSAYDEDTSDEAIDPCDARIALMKVMNKNY